MIRNQMHFAVLLTLLFTIPAFAANVENIAIAPSDAWLGDSINISAVCTNSTPITRVYTDITGPGVILPSLEMIGSGTYAITVPGNYFDRAGSYTANISCITNDSTSSTVGFAISTLSSAIGLPSYAYAGNTLEIAFVPKKNDVPITSGVTFTVMIESQVTSTIMPPIYDTQKGWLLRITAPVDPRTYSVSVAASYQGKTLSSSGSVEIKPPTALQITQIDKTSLVREDNVSIVLKATDKGTDIPVTTGNLAVRVGSVTANIASLTKSGSTTTVKFTVPDLSPGTYQIVAELSYNGTTYTDSRNVEYPATLTGRFADDSDTGITGEIKFIKSGSTIKDVNFQGSYSSPIVPDIYDVEISTPDALIKINGANVNTFTNAINYTKYLRAIDGLVMSNFYIVKTPWSFNSATVRLNYDASLIPNLDDVYVFRCDDWNYYNNKCNVGWIKIKPDISSGRVTFSTSNFGVFAVGTEEKIKVSLNFDKTRYPRKDIISLRGSTSGFNKQIPNTTVRIKIDGTYVDHTIVSNEFGSFALEFLSPDSEGNYTIKVTASRPPYYAYTGTQKIEILSMPSLSVVFPGSIQIEKGKEFNESILVVNKGQKDITNIEVGLDLDQSHYILGTYPNTLKPGEEYKIPITFLAYDNDDTTTKSVVISVKSSELSEGKIFGFTITEKVQQKAGITGFSVLPQIDGETTYTIIFAILAFAAALLLKRVKNYTSVNSTRQFFSNTPPSFATQQSDAAAYLNDVKGYLRGKGV